jgi:glycolate oxidase FAD binding subunit
MTAEQARGMLEVATREASASGGHVVLPRCPTAWKRDLRVWGPPREDAWLMAEVKRRLDPAGLFNPGRFLDGL